MQITQIVHIAIEGVVKMKTIAKKLMAIMLVVLMFSISPLCDAAPVTRAAGEDSSGGSLAIGGGVGLVVGALLGGLIVSRRKKRPAEA